MKIIAFTGAGISKASGIPTFQDMPGIRDKLTRSYAMKHPEKYKEMITALTKQMTGKQPNDAHLALAEYDIPVITMNIDTLHEDAGSKNILKIHGRLPTDEELAGSPHLLKEAPVLYDDEAPKYWDAFNMVDTLTEEDIFLIIGSSEYTSIARQLRLTAECRGATVYIINSEAETKVREFLKEKLTGNERG